MPRGRRSHRYAHYPGVQLNADELEPAPAPAQVANGASHDGPYLSPKKRLMLYSSDDWEEFILEWLTVMAGEYKRVLRFGGTGDKGVDVAGFADDDGFAGEWDLYQAKHYDHSLTPANVFPEILKLLVNLCEGIFSQRPRRYYFCAPRGCGTSLGRLLNDAPQLKAKFLVWLDSSDKTGFTFEQVSSVKLFANTFDFSVFRDTSVDEMIAKHSSSPYHLARFGAAHMPLREAAGAPPGKIQLEEMRYVEQLAEVYSHEWPTEGITSESVGENKMSSKPFQRQRVRFYSAESLRRYARDSTPDGTFEALRSDMLDGVIDTAEGLHGSPLARMNAVFEVAGGLDLRNHVLVKVLNQSDRKGICHQLANDDEIVWKPNAL
jgi:hypothetical protein